MQAEGLCYGGQALCLEAHVGIDVFLVGSGLGLRFHYQGEQLWLIHGEPDKGHPKAFKRGIERKAVTHPLPVQFPGFLPDGVPDSLNGSEGREDSVGTAAEAGTEVPGRKGRGTSGAHQIKGCRKDSFFCDSNRSCHNRCSEIVWYKITQRSGIVQLVFGNYTYLSTHLSISIFILERRIH